MDSSTAVDPFHQTLNFTLPDGTLAPVALPDIDEYVVYGMRICINYATQIGASAILLVVLLLTTRNEKRLTAVFVLNVIALLCNVVRLILACLYFTGPFYELYAYMTGDFSNVTQTAKNTSVAVLPLVLILQGCINASLVMQVRALTTTLAPAPKATLLATSVLVGLTAWCIRLALTVENAKAILASTDFSDYTWLIKASMYATTASFCYFSAVFIAKLGVAIRRRRAMHVRRFGPLQVLFVSGCQTLVLPALFAILQTCTEIPEIGSQVLTFVALSLPLTSMWASATLDKRPADDRAQVPREQAANRSSTRFSALRGLLSALSWPTSSTSSNGPLTGKSALPVFELSTPPRSSSATSTESPTSTSTESPPTTKAYSRQETSTYATVSAGDDDIEREMRMHVGRSMV